MPPSTLNNVACNVSITTNEVVQSNQCLTVINPNVTNTILHTSESSNNIIHNTENNPLNVSEKENCSNFAIAESKIDVNHNCDIREISEECEINNSSFTISINSTETTPQSILKRFIVHYYLIK